MQAVMKPRNVNLTSSTASNKAMQPKPKVLPATQQKPGRRFLDCLMAALSGWPV